MNVRALFVAAVTFCAPALAWEFKRDSSGEPVRWQAATLLNVDAQLDARLGAEGARSAVAAAVNALATQVPALAISSREALGGKVGFDFQASGQNRNDVVALDAWNYDAEAVAVTLIPVDKKAHAIVDADIAFNAGHEAWAVVDPAHPGNRHYDVQNAFNHELGHWVGLAHSQDKEAVMFPSTHPGETTKRAYAADDRTALETLYPLASPGPADPQTQGCSTTGGPALTLATLGLLALLQRRRVALAVLLLSPVIAAQAGEPAPLPRLAVVARVTAVRTLPPQTGTTVLKSEVWVQVADCLASPCQEQLRVLVAGGSWGNYTQTVGGVDVPTVGELIGLTRDAGRDAWVRLERLADAAARARFVTEQKKTAVPAVRQQTAAR